MTTALTEDATAAATQLVVVVPLFNEAEAIATTLRGLCVALAALPGLASADVVLVDDGSGDGSLTAAVHTWENLAPAPRPLRLHTLRLACNQGHQRAILAGLRYAVALSWDGCLIMDADGQDDPTAIALMGEALIGGAAAVFAKRTKRGESGLWVLSYHLYQLLFRVLLGRTLPLGNFCLLRRTVVERLCREGDLTHLAATVASYPVRQSRVNVPRLRRHAGETKMRPWHLVDYAAAAMTASVQAWMVLFTRLTVFAAAMSLLCGGVVAAIRLFTPWAISGWASTICLVSLGITLQALGFLAMTAFMRRILSLLAPVHVEAEARLIGACGSQPPHPLQPTACREAG